MKNFQSTRKGLIVVLCLVIVAAIVFFVTQFAMSNQGTPQAPGSPTYLVQPTR